MTRMWFLLLLLPTLALAQPTKAPTGTPAKVVAKAPAKAPVKAPAKVAAPAKVVLAPASVPASAPAVALPATPQKVAVPPASQAASQPAAPAAWKVWLQANWLWLLVAVVIPSILNGLRKKGVRAGLIGFFEMLLDRLSVLTNKNSPNTIKMLGTRSQKPKE